MDKPWIAALSLLAVACMPAASVDPGPQTAPSEPALRADGVATGSTTVVSDTNGALYSVNADAGTVSRSDTRTGAVTEVTLGGEPSRIAIHDNRLFVTLRAARAVVTLDITDFAAGPQQRVTVGAEPVGVVVREDGARVYVAVSQRHEVHELDGTTLAPLRVFPLGSGEPRYLALHPSGSSLYVGLGRGFAGVRRIDLDTGSVESIALPQTERFSFFTGESVPLQPRVTGDLWVTADGSQLLIPALYTDTTTPVLALGSVEEIPTDTALFPEEGGGGGYGGGEPVDRVNPTIVDVGVESDGAPSGEARALLVRFAVDFSEPTTIGSYLSSVTSNAEGTAYAATMEASDVVVLLDPRPEAQAWDIPVNLFGGLDFFPAQELEFMGFGLQAMGAFDAGNGVNGATFAGDRLFANAGFAGAVVETPGALEHHDQIVFEEVRARVATWVTVQTPGLTLTERTGRDFFFDARGESMGGSGVSCSTCHFEGRNDGVTWTFDDGPRQTPSLAGVVSETTPVTWRSNVPSVADEASITIQGRLGGPEPSAQLLDSIAAFVDSTRIPDTPAPDAAAAARGEALFAQSGCSSCHSGSRHTDNGDHTIRAVELNTPSLSGIAATAPYLHDGSAATLRDVLELSNTGGMGYTGGLSDSELDDLEAYLRSL